MGSKRGACDTIRLISANICIWCSVESHVSHRSTPRIVRVGAVFDGSLILPLQTLIVNFLSSIFFKGLQSKKFSCTQFKFSAEHML